MKIAKVIRIIRRNGPGDFDVEDENQSQWRVQSAFQIEEKWQETKTAREKYHAIHKFDLSTNS